MNDSAGFSQTLLCDIAKLPGVARRRAALLQKLEIHTWFDLLTWFPRDYEDWSQCQPLSGLTEQAEATFLAGIAQKPVSRRKGRLVIIEAVLSDNESSVRAIWFNQPWLVEQLKTGDWYQFRGKTTRRGRQVYIQSPAMIRVDPEDPRAQGIKPVYRLTAGLNQGVMRNLVNNLLPLLLGKLPEPLPSDVRKKHSLCAVDYAYSRIHNPTGWEEAAICRRRLVFEEFFLLQAGLHLLRRSDRSRTQAHILRINAEQGNKWRQTMDALPFRLTGAQQSVLKEVISDLNRPMAMNRLVQGDVGSGKTVVAALAMLHAALCGYQAVMMAPTAILARQHFQTLSNLLGSGQVRICLLTGATPAGEKQRIIRELADGHISILVGTHALIEDKIQFQALALAVTDEQHRFGVRQRLRLAQQDRENPDGKQPHVLVMTATPIPRSLALVVYGDLDISVINEKPAGRKTVRTYTARAEDRPRVERLLRKTLSQGRQAYIVCPLIETEAELDSDLESVIKMYNRLAGDVLADYRVGLMHGQLKQPEKDKVMDEFAGGRIDALVSTTVIEVGVDNPNAALMIIENAERFGLAQLHQLRGRIGRGGSESICVLMSDKRDEITRERLKVLCHSSDGFAIAEKDLDLRGPGDFFGTRQHGLPPLRLARIYQDFELLQAARDSLVSITAVDPDLRQGENDNIRQALNIRFGRFFSRPGL